MLDYRPLSTPIHGQRYVALRCRQSGIALIVGLLILIVVTLIGLAGIRGTLTQHIMSANFYDRETAMQSAESALRVAQSVILANPAAYGRDCSAAGVACTGNPFTDANLPNNAIVTVTAGNQSTQYTASAVAPGQPRYVIEYMGQFQDPNSNTNYTQTANSFQYGGASGAQVYNYFRITAQSAAFAGRSVVTVQAFVKQ